MVPSSSLSIWSAWSLAAEEGACFQKMVPAGENTVGEGGGGPRTSPDSSRDSVEDQGIGRQGCGEGARKIATSIRKTGDERAGARRHRAAFLRQGPSRGGRAQGLWRDLVSCRPLFVPFRCRLHVLMQQWRRRHRLLPSQVSPNPAEAVRSSPLPPTTKMEPSHINGTFLFSRGSVWVCGGEMD